LKEQIGSFFKHSTERFPELVRSYSTGYELGHGRLEKRDIFVISTTNTKLLFSGVQQVAVLHRYRENLSTNKISEEVVYLITNGSSDEFPPKRLAELKRSYWDIENKLHYVKDNVFGEDRSTIRARFGAQNMSALRNLAVSIYRASGIQNMKRCVDNIRYNTGAFLHTAFAVT